MQMKGELIPWLKEKNKKIHKSSENQFHFLSCWRYKMRGKKRRQLYANEIFVPHIIVMLTDCFQFYQLIMDHQVKDKPIIKEHKIGWISWRLWEKYSVGNGLLNSLHAQAIKKAWKCSSTRSCCYSYLLLWLFSYSQSRLFGNVGSPAGLKNPLVQLIACQHTHIDSF